ncbi:MAG: hypothetical protein R3304_05605 [Longimicrobiales bacterium]|nr:hypothetical protein [Longimicrobiales bacterium]
MSRDQDTEKTTTDEVATEEGLRTRLTIVESEAARLRQTLRWIWVGMAASVGLIVGIAASSGAFNDEPGVVEATRLLLVNEEGKARGEWLIDDEGNARIVLKDQQQRDRMLLSVRTGGWPGIALVNEAGQRRVALGLLPDETTSLVFADGGGIPRAVLGLTGGESANLVLADREGVSRIGLGLDGSGMGSVLLPDQSDR